MVKYYQMSSFKEQTENKLKWYTKKYINYMENKMYNFIRYLFGYNEPRQA